MEVEDHGKTDRERQKLIREQNILKQVCVFCCCFGFGLLCACFVGGGGGGGGGGGVLFLWHQGNITENLQIVHYFLCF